jgi:lysine 2,3-aminomutase
MFENEERSGLNGHRAVPRNECDSYDDEEPPGKPKRHPLWRKVPKRQWDDWRWQSQNAIRSVRQLRELIPFSPEELEAIGTLEAEYKLAIPPYFFSLINTSDPNDPIRLQSVTSPLEAKSTFELEDPLEEDKDSPVPGITHRYPDRVLMVTTHVCTMYCRFCTRKRATMVRGGWDAISRDDERMIEYVREHPQIRDVIVSGGDPLTLPPAKLKYFLHSLRDIPHVDVIRIGTRVPTTLPQKLYDPELLDILESSEKVWIQTHFNHPREVTPEVARVCKSLLTRGMPLNNHTVLMKGVNDDLATMRKLMRALLRVKIRPYYLFHCDPVIGAGHFRTSIWKGLEIMEGLRGHLSGLAIPTYCVDAPHGGGKIPLLPNYLVSASDDCVILRNYEGMLVRYQAEDKEPTTKATANRGVSQLIQGTKTAIVPRESERLDRRRQYLQNKVSGECCDEGDADGEERLASLPVVAK